MFHGLMKFDLNGLRPAAGLAALIGLAAGAAFSQPAGVPAGANARCAAGPGAASDTVVAQPDSAGFRPIFNGTDFTGWWESCQTSHSTEKVEGGIWLVDPEQKAIFSNQRLGGSGSILMTNKTYTNYEIVMDLWPDFGNDAGLFHRTNQSGRCYQTVIDYIGAGSVGGVWGEANYHTSTLDIRPFRMGNNEGTITDRNSWSFTGAWSDAWDVNGWNQLRSEVFGNPPRVRSYIRKLGAPNWILVLDHTSPVSNQPSGYIGLQIHSGTGRWSGRAGNWYRNIKVRPLTTTGDPIIDIPTSLSTPATPSRHGLKAIAGALVGTSDMDYSLIIRNLHGREISRFQGRSGAFTHPFPSKAGGMLIAEIRTAKGVESQKLISPLKL